MAVDAAGNVYFAATGNTTVRVITPAGVVSTLAGSVNQFGSADGTGSAARFAFLVGVAADASGILYVGDDSNDTIRAITPAGVVSTLAGLAASSATSTVRAVQLVSAARRGSQSTPRATFTWPTPSTERFERSRLPASSPRLPNSRRALLTRGLPRPRARLMSYSGPSLR